MKYIDFYLASPVTDMHNERMEFGNYFRALNDTYVNRNVYFHLHMSDDPVEMLKEAYEDVVDMSDGNDSDYFVMLFGDIGDDYHKVQFEDVVKKFESALGKFKESDKPKILAFYDTSNEGKNPDVTEFVRRLGDEIKHYYTTYTDIDSVKLKLLLNLATNDRLYQKVEFRDGCVWVNDSEFENIDLGNIPVYKKHGAINAGKEELRQIEGELTKLREKQLSGTLSDDESSDLGRLRRRADEIKDKIHKDEMDLCKASIDVVKRFSDNTPVEDPILRMALREFDNGNMDGVMAILDDEERMVAAKRTDEKISVGKKMVSAGEEIISQCTTEYQQYVDQISLKISGCEAAGLTDESVEYVIALYEEMWRYIEQGDLSREPLIKYLFFLMNIKEYETGINRGEKLLLYFNRDIYNDNVQRYIGAICNILGGLYSEIKDYKNAILRFEGSISIYEKLLDRASDVDVSEIATMYNNAGTLYYYMKEYNVAEKYYNTSLEFLKNISKYSPSKRGIAATICNNLGNLYADLKMNEDAEKFYLVSLNLYRMLSKECPEVYEPKLANICNGLGVLYCELKNYSESEKYYKESINLYEKLSNNLSEVYEFEIARGYGNIGLMFDKINKNVDAEICYNESLKIFRNLSAKKSGVYESYIAWVCNSLGGFCGDQARYDETEKYYKESLALRRTLSEKNHDVYDSDLASICYNLANFYSDLSKHDEAKTYYGESLELYRKLAKKTSGIYDEEIATIQMYLDELKHEEKMRNINAGNARHSKTTKMRIGRSNPKSKKKKKK